MIAGSTDRIANPRWRIAASVIAIAVYVVACIQLGDQGGIRAVYVAESVWPLLAVATGRLCGLRLKQLLALLASAALTGLAWSLVLVDFPPPSAERASVAVQWTLLTAPALLAVMLGLGLRHNGPLAAGLMLTLGAVAAFPPAIWNVESTVVGGWRAYPYPTLGGGIAFLTLCALLGFAGGYLGYRLRARLSRA
jgi:hypothetical protein